MSENKQKKNIFAYGTFSPQFQTVTSTFPTSAQEGAGGRFPVYLPHTHTQPKGLLIRTLNTH